MQTTALSAERIAEFTVANPDDLKLLPRLKQAIDDQRRQIRHDVDEALADVGSFSIQLWVQPHTRDLGVTIAPTKGEVERQIGAALTGQTAHAFRLRNASDVQPDPLARMCSLLRAAHEGMEGSEFKQLVQTPLEQQAYLALFGDMKDHQRAAVWDKITKGVFEAQQAALQEAHRAHQRDAKRTDQLLKGRALQERIAQHANKRRKVPDAE